MRSPRLEPCLQVDCLGAATTCKRHTQACPGETSEPIASLVGMQTRHLSSHKQTTLRNPKKKRCKTAAHFSHVAVRKHHRARPLHTLRTVQAHHTTTNTPCADSAPHSMTRTSTQTPNFHRPTYTRAVRLPSVDGMLPDSLLLFNSNSLQDTRTAIASRKKHDDAAIPRQSPATAHP